MPTNDFLPFGIAAVPPDILSQAAWAAAVPAAGRGAGIVPRDYFNKAHRQPAVMAAALGMFLNSKGEDALDNGDVPTLSAAIAAAVAASGLQVSDFTGANQQLSANGWQDLPGGLILQWVSGIVVSGPSFTAFSWAKTFPNAVFGALVATNGSFLSTQMVGVTLLNTTGGRIDSGFGSDTPTCFIVGIGH